MKELKNTEIPWNQLSPQLQDKYCAQAEYLISRGYTGAYAVYTLAEIVYNKAMLIKETSDNHGDLAK
jgi:hypothetical protein